MPVVLLFCDLFPRIFRRITVRIPQPLRMSVILFAYDYGAACILPSFSSMRFSLHPPIQPSREPTLRLLGAC